MHQHHHGPSLSGDLKRKRSPSHDHVHPAAAQKAAKTSSNHLQINYLARHCENDLPLLTNDDTLPNILSLLSDYQGVLDRHESMACNLGARPLGPILIKRFERLFDGPPRVLKSHGRDGTTVTWLDVVEFARNKPEQFQLGQMSEGIRVCQFYTKQCRVQISEEDFVLISSGIPQKMIPPQPIIEDEEKELGTLEILERNLGQICQLADQAKPPKPADLGPAALAQQRPLHMSDSELHQVMNSPVPIPNTPSSLLPAASQRAQQPQDKDDGGPFKAEMVHRMESLAKGERILPPCDRCRRLHMDCLKNLTACMGCTRKHAKCSWREVRENEIRGSYSHPPSTGVISSMHSESDEGEVGSGLGNGMHVERASTGSPAGMLSPQRGGLTPSHVGPSPTPQQQHLPPEHRIPSSRNSPPPHEREPSRGVEAQLQEAAKSGLAHASARLGGPPESSKPPEYQAMVA
ncbi:hypothetical protein SLS60_011307 [Paraconiothyrium brasiliense]|uniref:Zn(2)-C6 fungal-type domain-containing protein n=1 Tax=Paraconiothyrium brasiliense TaxID=300254 RepID=A0ABR3QJA9_9PLEO